MSDQLYRLAEGDPEFGIYRKAIENRDGTLPDGVLVWYGHDNYLQGFLVPVKRCEHGKIDRHQSYVHDEDGDQQYHPNGVAIWQWCPGAVLGVEEDS